MGLSDNVAEATNKMPYASAFRFEVVILLEVGLPTIWTEVYNVNYNAEVLVRDLNLANEWGKNALIRMANYQKQLAKTYNQKVQYIHFSIRDLILRKVVENTNYPADRKLSPNWKGPYKITKLVGKCTYDPEGKQVPRW